LEDSVVPKDIYLPINAVISLKVQSKPTGNRPYDETLAASKIQIIKSFSYLLDLKEQFLKFLFP